MRVFNVFGFVYTLFVIVVLTPMTMAESEKFEFQAEVSRLMDIIINSLYQKKEIFLRELISNGSDALDKLRILALEHPELFTVSGGKKLGLEMRISFDAEAKTLTIRDTGIGMTREDLIENLGTVAKSGTTQFVESMASGSDMSLIGQFGVGFYSVYLVADRVSVKSKNPNDEQYVWESTADSTFSVELDPEGDTLGRGTEITLHLKEDAMEYSNQERLETLIKRYSEFITFPIYLHQLKTVSEPEPEEEEGEGEAEDNEEDDDDISVSDEEETDKAQPTKTEKKWVWDQVNTQKAIWTRNEAEVTAEEYEAFYQSMSKDYAGPLTWTHFKAEGEVEFKSILFVPKHSPGFEQYQDSNAQIKLYVRKVLITEEVDDLIPKYLSFIKGVVDSDDLPVNVARESLQQHKALKVMGKKLVRKILDLLKKMADKEEKEARAAKEGEEEEEEADEEEEEDEEEDDEEESSAAVASYKEFWNTYSKAVKLGVIEDSSNRKRLVKLLRFPSTTKETERTSFDGYVERMQDWQKHIYYITGTDLASIKKSPFLERARAKGVEVLLMNDPLDEYVLPHISEYDGFPLQSLTKEGLVFGDETELDAKREKAYKAKFKPLTEWMKSLLSDKLDKVTVSNRVTDSPAILVTSQFGHSATMEKILKHQAMGSRNPAVSGKRQMEINPRHPIVDQLRVLIAEDAEGEKAKDLARLLYDTSLLNSGFEMDDTVEFAHRMYRLMQIGMSLENLDLLPELSEDELEEPAAEVKEEPVEEKLEL